MKRFAVALVPLGLAAAAAPVSAATHPHCPASGKTVVRTSDGRVWGVGSGITRYYGCAFSVGKVFRLDPPRGQLIAWKPKVKIAGTAVAFEAMDFDIGPYRVMV